VRWASRRTQGGFHVSPLQNEFTSFTPAAADLPYLFSFIGSTASAPVRRKLAGISHPRGFFRDTAEEFERALYDRMTLNERRDYHRQFVEVTKASKFVLCPRGLGAATIRLMETMRMGRVPVIISDDWVPPNGPSWEGFSIRVPEDAVTDIPRLLETREPDALAMGQLAREEWQRWFSDEVAFHRVVDWCLQIRDRRRLPEAIARLPVYLQLLRPFHLKWALRSLLRKEQPRSDTREPRSPNTLRIALTKVAKAFLSPFRFRGKGRILSTLCPRAGRIRITLFGYEFWCDLSESIQRNIFLFGYDDEAERFIRSKLRVGDTFLDIGANVGFYSLLASSIVGERGRVIAIEPNPKTFLRLKETIAANAITNVVPLNLALGRERGRLDLFIDPESGNDTATMVTHDGRTSVKVEVYPLDEIATTHQIDRIDYLKIDVDGFEPDVFAGAKRLLTDGKIKFIQTEFCDYWLRRNSSSPQMLHQLITRAGFTDTNGTPTFTDHCIIDRFFARTSI
jgi:FkbM family methyltransferase